MTADAPIVFIDLQAQRARLGAPLEESLLRVVRSGRYILGPEIAELETMLAAFCGAPYALSCANGTDALALLLMLKDLKPGQAVLVPSFTFAATGEVVVWFGATPIFVDCDETTFCVDPASVEAGVARAKALGLDTVGLIAVDLFGHPADYDALEPLARKHGMWLMSDCAQGFGAKYKGRRVGSLGDFAATSFFPAKPLGCYGDGGATLSNDDAETVLMRSIAFHGASGDDKYNCARIGMNSRLDTIQAAILIEKLAIFADEIRARNEVADRYAQMLEGLVTTPKVIEGGVSTWAQYVIEHEKRDALAAHLREAGVPSAQYYPKPLHKQTAYESFPVGAGGLKVSEDIAHRVLALPMHPYLDGQTQTKIAGAIREFVTAGG